MWARCGHVYHNEVDMCINILKELAVSKNVALLCYYKYKISAVKHIDNGKPLCDRATLNT